MKGEIQNRTSPKIPKILLSVATMGGLCPLGAGTPVIRERTPPRGGLNKEADLLRLLIQSIKLSLMLWLKNSYL